MSSVSIVMVLNSRRTRSSRGVFDRSIPPTGQPIRRESPAAERSVSGVWAAARFESRRAVAIRKGSVVFWVIFRGSCEDFAFLGVDGIFGPRPFFVKGVVRGWRRFLSRGLRGDVLGGSVSLFLAVLLRL